MSWLRRVTALLLRGRGFQVTAQPTLPAGPVPPERTAQTGNKPFAQVTPLQPQPAPQAPKHKPEPAAPTKSAAKRGNALSAAQPPEPLTPAGSKKAAPASQPRPPASPAQKRAKKPANKTKPAAKRTPSKTPARTRTASQPKGRGS